MKRHTLKLAKNASLWTTKSIHIGDDKYIFNLYTYGNRTGFVHFARLNRITYKDGVDTFEHIADAKAQYINRTWERFTGASTYRQALNYAVASKDITNWTKEEIFKSLDRSI
jgi:hypothetical protein